MILRVDTMSDGSEIVHYDRQDIPLYIRMGKLSFYDQKKAQCHWHEDIELIYIIDGCMNYYIDGESVLLEKDDVIMVNSRKMHYGYAHKDRDCNFICVLFDISLLSSCRSIISECIDPFVLRSNISYLIFRSGYIPLIQKNMLKIWDYKKEHEEYYEMNVTGCLCLIWVAAIKDCSPMESDIIRKPAPDVSSLKKMVTYIHEHYRENITLKDIASSANMCCSKCCAVFRQQIHQTPFNFLNSYRMHMSAYYLIKTQQSVTEIASDCGFGNLSYFSKLFTRYMHCTPREYRRRNSPCSAANSNDCATRRLTSPVH